MKGVCERQRSSRRWAWLESIPGASPETLNVSEAIRSERVDAWFQEGDGLLICWLTEVDLSLRF